MTIAHILPSAEVSYSHLILTGIRHPTLETTFESHSNPILSILGSGNGSLFKWSHPIDKEDPKAIVWQNHILKVYFSRTEKDLKLNFGI